MLVPKNLMGRVFRAVPSLMRAAASRGAWTDHLTERTRAIALHNNRVGALRLNVAGREPQGNIAEVDVDDELTRLEKRLGALRHATTGEPVVLHTLRPAEEYGPEAHPDLPDLLVVFRRDLGELTDIVCPEAGRLSVPTRRPEYQRTGDHSDQSHIWIDHPRVTQLDDVRSEDIAPTILTLLDVDVPEDIDGRVSVRLSPVSRR